MKNSSTNSLNRPSHLTNYRDSLSLKHPIQFSGKESFTLVDIYGKEFNRDYNNALDEFEQKVIKNFSNGGYTPYFEIHPIRIAKNGLGKHDFGLSDIYFMAFSETDLDDFLANKSKYVQGVNPDNSNYQLLPARSGGTKANTNLPVSSAQAAPAQLVTTNNDFLLAIQEMAKLFLANDAAKTELIAKALQSNTEITKEVLSVAREAVQAGRDAIAAGKALGERAYELSTTAIQTINQLTLAHLSVFREMSYSLLGNQEPQPKLVAQTIEKFAAPPKEELELYEDAIIVSDNENPDATGGTIIELNQISPLFEQLPVKLREEIKANPGAAADQIAGLLELKAQETILEQNNPEILELGTGKENKK